MAFVRVEQHNARLAAAVRMESVTGRDGQSIAKVTLDAISNNRRGEREEAVAIRWTAWGKQAENAARYLTKGSRVSVVGRVQNNNYEKDGATVYAFDFTVEELEYLDTKEQGEALRSLHEAPVETPASAKQVDAKPARAKPRNGKATAATDDDVPF